MRTAPLAPVAEAIVVEVELLLVVIPDLPQLFFPSLDPAETTMARSINFKTAFIIF
jgi:hypothetical protein